MLSMGAFELSVMNLFWYEVPVAVNMVNQFSGGSRLLRCLASYV